MKKEQLEKRKLIRVQGIRPIHHYKFLQELYTAFEEGYVLPPEDAMWRQDMPVFRHNRKQVFLYPEGYEVPAPTGTVAKDDDESVIKASDEQILKEIEEEQKALEIDKEDASTTDSVNASEETQKEEEEEEVEPVVSENAEPTPEVTPSNTSPVERVKAESSKDGLLDLAKEFEIEVPEDKKNPAAIKKFLLGSLNK